MMEEERKKALNEISQKQNLDTNKHPLKNNDSKHYEMVGGDSVVELMEKMFTREELMIWSKITIMKYRLRIGHKDEPQKELKKIKTYEDYYRHLEGDK